MLKRSWPRYQVKAEPCRPRWVGKVECARASHGSACLRATNINLSLHTLGRCIEALCLKVGRCLYCRKLRLTVKAKTRLLQDTSVGLQRRDCSQWYRLGAECNKRGVLRFADNAKIIQHVRITETRTIDMQMVARPRKKLQC